MTSIKCLSNVLKWCQSSHLVDKVQSLLSSNCCSDPALEGGWVHKHKFRALLKEPSLAFPEFLMLHLRCSGIVRKNPNFVAFPGNILLLQATSQKITFQKLWQYFLQKLNSIPLFTSFGETTKNLKLFLLFWAFKSTHCALALFKTSEPDGPPWQPQPRLPGSNVSVTVDWFPPMLWCSLHSSESVSDACW